MAIPDTMQGVQLVGHGGPDKLVWNDAIPIPRPGPGEALVKVLAAGVNNTDINTRIGWYSKQVSEGTEATGSGVEVEQGGWAGAIRFPRIQGGDLCGTVVALGAGVANIALGRRVICPINQPGPTVDEPTRFLALGSEFDGAFAQYCLVPAAQLHDVGDAPLSDVELGAIPCAYGTAYNLLSRAAVTSGDRVLITGASGGVGLALVQLAALRGAHVIGLAQSSKHDAVRAAGAAEVFDRHQRPHPKSVTAVIDVVGGSDWPALIDALVPGGRYATSGAIAGPIVQVDLRTLYLNDITIDGCTYTPHEVFRELVALVNRGLVRPRVSKVYSLSDIVAAQADFAAKRYAGKLVLVPPGV